MLRMPRFHKLREVLFSSCNVPPMSWPLGRRCSSTPFVTTKSSSACVAVTACFAHRWLAGWGEYAGAGEDGVHPARFRSAHGFQCAFALKWSPKSNCTVNWPLETPTAAACVEGTKRLPAAAGAEQGKLKVAHAGIRRTLEAAGTWK